MIRPTRNRVLVRVDEVPQEGLIHIPESARGLSQYGTVMAVGPKVQDLQVGNRVYFVPQRSFHEIHLNDGVHRLFEETQLEGILE